MRYYGSPMRLLWAKDAWDWILNQSMPDIALVTAGSGMTQPTHKASAGRQKSAAHVSYFSSISAAFC